MIRMPFAHPFPPGATQVLCTARAPTALQVSLHLLPVAFCFSLLENLQQSLLLTPICEHGSPTVPPPVMGRLPLLLPRTDKRHRHGGLDILLEAFREVCGLPHDQEFKF